MLCEHVVTSYYSEIFTLSVIRLLKLFRKMLPLLSLAGHWSQVMTPAVVVGKPANGDITG